MVGNREFVARLKQCRDESGTPNNARERASILSKMLHIPKHQAWSFLEGQQMPEPQIVEMIAQEFEVDPKWLSGDKA